MAKATLHLTADLDVLNRKLDDKDTAAHIGNCIIGLLTETDNDFNNGYVLDLFGIQVESSSPAE